jgi:Ankyrin repeats (many copies)
VVAQHDSSGTEVSADRDLFALFGAIAAGDRAAVRRRLDGAPHLASLPIRVAASRRDAMPYFLAAIQHYVYAGDTALHIAAAAYRRDVAEALLARGAEVRARNRRGAEPLHYAADGGPGTSREDPAAQGDVIACLIAAGADPDAVDSSGVAPIHRAVRNRCSAAAGSLIDNGADPLLANGRGSTPLHLAVRNTGKSNSGSDASKDEQGRLIALLLRHGASPADTDANGRSVADAASGDRIRRLLGILR